MKPIPLDPAAHHGDKSLATLINEAHPTRPNYGWRYQNGVKPGERKLEQFKEVLRLRNTPRLGSQDGLGKDALVMVKLFNPSGSQSWFITEWDGDDEVFCYVTGMDYDEWGSSSLAEMAFLKGRYGIGIEIEMTEPVKPLREYLKADGKDDDGEPAEEPGEPTPPPSRPPSPSRSENESEVEKENKPRPPAPLPTCPPADPPQSQPSPIPTKPAPTMFKSLTQLLDAETVLQLTVALVDADTLSVVVIPKHLGEDAKRKAVLQQPLHLTATAAELDAGFAEAVKTFQTGRMSLDEQVKSALSAAEAAAAMTKAEGQRPKPTPPGGSGKPTKPGKPVPMPAAVTAPKPAGEKVGKGESETKATSPAPQPTRPPAAPTATAPSAAPAAPNAALPKPPPGLLGRPSFVPGQLKQPLSTPSPTPVAETAPAAAPTAATPLFEGH